MSDRIRRGNYAMNLRGGWRENIKMLTRSGRLLKLSRSVDWSSLDWRKRKTAKHDKYTWENLTGS